MFQFLGSTIDTEPKNWEGFYQNNKYCAQEIGYIVQYLFKVMKKEDIYGREKWYYVKILDNLNVRIILIEVQSSIFIDISYRITYF